MNQHILLFPVIFLAVIFTSCQNKTGSEDTNSETGSEIIDDKHNAHNSLDWSGTYKGILPCADCEGIETTIILNNDLSYFMETKYLGEGDTTFEEKGTFTWNKEGNTITFSDVESGTGHYFVGENHLIHLDREGNKITEPLAEHYVLKKVSAPILSDAQLSETYWKLMELGGGPIESSEGKKEIHITFNAGENRVSGFAGCNSFRGNYSVTENKQISISDVVSTKMACPNLATETEFMKALSTADRYKINRRKLSLYNVEKSLLAIFEAAE